VLGLVHINNTIFRAVWQWM